MNYERSLWYTEQMNEPAGIIGVLIIASLAAAVGFVRHWVKV